MNFLPHLPFRRMINKLLEIVYKIVNFQSQWERANMIYYTGTRKQAEDLYICREEWISCR